jgi:uncharacterized protein (DUF924 family)
MATAEQIIEYWFGTDLDDGATAKARAPLWWSKNPHADAEIKQRFEMDLTLAANVGLAHWRSTPHGWLALILLTDQFPRSIYRDSAKAFAFDPMALALCHDGLAAQIDAQLRPIERVFFYLPLEHSEQLADQDKSVAHFATLLARVSPQWRNAFAEYLDFATRHREVIRRFGRFPHRNAILGRISAAEEVTFLKTAGSSF